MTYQQTAALLDAAMNYWDNICSRTEEESTIQAWAVTLADIPFAPAMKAVQELSKVKDFKPKASEVLRVAKEYHIYSPENWSMRLVWDRYIELGVSPPKWFFKGVEYRSKAYPQYLPEGYRKVYHDEKQISAGDCG